MVLYGVDDAGITLYVVKLALFIGTHTLLKQKDLRAGKFSLKPLTQ